MTETFFVEQKIADEKKANPYSFVNKRLTMNVANKWNFNYQSIERRTYSKFSLVLKSEPLLDQ